MKKSLKTIQKRKEEWAFKKQFLDNKKWGGSYEASYEASSVNPVREVRIVCGKHGKSYSYSSPEVRWQGKRTRYSQGREGIGMEEIYHFTKDGELWHCDYVKILKKGVAEFRKLPGTEEKCHCPEREQECQALLKTKESKIFIEDKGW